MVTVGDLLQLVKSATDDHEPFDELEVARAAVGPEQVSWLVSSYQGLTSWPARAALVWLIQDHLSEASRPLMSHFLLHSPPDTEGWDRMRVTRAIALCHLERDLDLQEALMDDPPAVEAGRKRWAEKA